MKLEARFTARSLLSLRPWRAMPTSLPRMLIAAAAGVAAASALGADLPSGWRLPVAADYFDSEVLEDATNPLEVDLDGDGVPDSTYLLVEQGTRNGAIFVRLASARRLSRISRSPLGVGDYVLAALPPGNYETSLGKLRFPSGAVSLREVEYGSGSVHWFENGAWHSVPITQGDFDVARP